MKVHTLLLICFTLMIPQISHAGMTCAAILEKAKPPGGKKSKGAKAACLLEEHSIGMGRGVTESIYVCKGAKYKLVTLEDYSCTVTVLHK